jgi:hypothetical protein
MEYVSLLGIQNTWHLTENTAHLHYIVQQFNTVEGNTAYCENHRNQANTTYRQNAEGSSVEIWLHVLLSVFLKAQQAQRSWVKKNKIIISSLKTGRVSCIW